MGFNTILAISWQSVLLVEETRVPGEYHWPAASHYQTLSHNVISSTARHGLDSSSQLINKKTPRNVSCLWKVNHILKIESLMKSPQQ